MWISSKEIFNYESNRIVFIVESDFISSNFTFPKVVVYRCCERHIRIEVEAGLLKKGISFYLSYTLKKYRPI